MHDKIIASYLTVEPIKTILFTKLFCLRAANDHHAIMALIQKKGESFKGEKIIRSIYFGCLLSICLGRIDFRGILEK